MNIDFSRFQQVKVLVVGDVMLDYYWAGSAERISPEAPVPVIHFNSEESRPGGAANAAINVAALGAQVTLFGFVGKDDKAEYLIEKLQDQGVTCAFERIANKPTIAKIRVIDRNQQLIRLDFEKTFKDIDPSQLLANFEAALKQADVVVLSDYDKGTLAHVQQLIALARAHQVPVIVDPKRYRYRDYQGATLITPNVKELVGAKGPCPTEQAIVANGMELINECQLEALLITRSEKGMTLLTKNNEPLHVPTRAREVYDVSGAGDTVVATLATAMGAGLPLVDAVSLANVAAGIVVRKMGVASATIPELRRMLTRQTHSDLGIFTENELLTAVHDAREHGETIVMTNGCFDILHAGHVAYLERAKALGKRLIVAINDDASVARLKGPARPLNSLRERMQVIASLRAVDWVVAFSEDTPARLIAEVLPNVLVKGGDYKLEEIAGHETVIDNGGKVEILPFVEGFSTSKLINKISTTVAQELTA